MRIYLLASFPSLSLHDPAPFSFTELLNRCAEHLSERDLDELDAICSSPPGGHTPFAREWADTWQVFDGVNRRERLRRLPRAAGDSLPDSPLGHDALRRDTLAAWEIDDPLRRETALLRAKWNWIDTHRREAPYSFTDLCGYALQLQLLERSASWEESAGQTQFDEHSRSVLDPLIETLRQQELSA